MPRCIDHRVFFWRDFHRIFVAFFFRPVFSDKERSKCPRAKSPPSTKPSARHRAKDGTWDNMDQQRINKCHCVWVSFVKIRSFSMQCLRKFRRCEISRRPGRAPQALVASNKWGDTLHHSGFGNNCECCTFKRLWKEQVLMHQVFLPWLLAEAVELSNAQLKWTMDVDYFVPSHIMWGHVHALVMVHEWHDATLAARLLLSKSRKARNRESRGTM